MTQKLESQWHWRGDFNKHFDTWHLEFHHGRHKKRHGDHVIFSGGKWWRANNGWPELIEQDLH